MKLTVLERFNLSDIYPQGSSLEGQLLVKEINEKVELTPEEREKVNFREEKADVVCPHCGKVVREANLVIRWDDEKYEKDIGFTNAELVFLKKNVDRLSSEYTITQKTLSVCQKVSALFPKEKKDEKKDSATS